jgi:hypothetical protein
LIKLAIKIFKRVEEKQAYLDWRAANPNGYVLNINTLTPSSTTMTNIIHSALKCSSLDTPPKKNRKNIVTPEHPKYCSMHYSELEKEMLNSYLPYKPCGICLKDEETVWRSEQNRKDVKSKEILVKEWYKKNIEPAELDHKIQASLTYVKRFTEPEGNKWTIWAYEVVSGDKGKDGVRVFLDKIIHQGQEHYMKQKGAPTSKEVKEDFKEVSRLLAARFNEFTKLGGRFKVDKNKADGSLGVMYEEFGL